ncbi:MAG TPA: hypothetical protein VFC84_00990 [Desulfosporosinus sp.]|nr:hypothetical protein [Desulfosporosinus sp.]
MDLLDLDVRIEKDLKHLEQSLIDYEILMREAATLKDQTKELLAVYEGRIEQLNAKFTQKEASSLKSAKSFNVDYKKVVTLFNAMESKQNLFEVYVKNDLSSLDGNVHERIDKLEAEHRKTLINIVNAQTVHEKQTLNSKKDVSEGVSDEVHEIAEKNRAIEVSIEAIHEGIRKLKSDSERSLINLSSELFKETTRAEEKDRKLAMALKIFMTISSVLFIVLLIWR